ncbi:hypothetical protein SAMN05216386_2545 [Nitrosospira briensis]|uniref:Uncharacterized protein n=1 Tax=Nitrosospira briensis TaxID=35799 RepID=A0A1I5E9G4_9PROT|nr:hypothetical protein [Nitrosospira briensis]SFO07721.1 hypothetical protein SAMN05216386_2545 [Nitrosospira briensis]
MNNWELLEIRESLLRDLAEFIEDNYYGTPAPHEYRRHELDVRLGKKLKFSSSYPQMTIRQRRASDLLLQVGLCGATEYALGTIEDEDQLKHGRERLVKMKGDLADLMRDYDNCLSEEERKLLLRQAKNNSNREESLKDSERDSLLKLVIGMAVGAYCYNPAALKNDAVSDITKDLEELGISISDDTVRKYLIQAAAKFPQARKA